MARDIQTKPLDFYLLCINIIVYCINCYFFSLSFVFVFVLFFKWNCAMFFFLFSYPQKVSNFQGTSVMPFILYFSLCIVYFHFHFSLCICYRKFWIWESTIYSIFIQWTETQSLRLEHRSQITQSQSINYIANSNWFVLLIKKKKRKKKMKKKKTNSKCSVPNVHCKIWTRKPDQIPFVGWIDFCRLF